MRALTLISILALGGCATTPQQQAAAANRAAADDQALHRTLAGLTPHGTTECLPPRLQTSLSAYGSKLVYTAGPGLAYVSDTGGGCEGVARGDILVTRTISSQTCRGDIATTVDHASRTITGSCGLGNFTKWSK